MNTLFKNVLASVGEKQYNQSYLGHSSYCKHPKESLLITATHKGPGLTMECHRVSRKQAGGEFAQIFEIRMLAYFCNSIWT